MIRIGCRTLLVVTAVSAAAGPSAAQEPPQADYYVYVAAESQDEVALVRFGPGGAEVSRTIEASSNPTDIGSLYYVLGSQAPSSRVKQLQKLLELRRDAEERARNEP